MRRERSSPERRLGVATDLSDNPGRLQRLITAATDPAVLMAMLHGRSYWEVRYHDGRVVREWECDWSMLPIRGRVEVRLACPNGRVAVLGNTKDATDRLFQFKCAQVSASVGGPSSRSVLAHVIGLIHGTDGQCTLYAWEFPGQLVGPLEDNANCLRYQQVGSIYGEHLGAKPD